MKLIIFIRKAKLNEVLYLILLMLSLGVQFICHILFNLCWHNVALLFEGLGCVNLQEIQGLWESKSIFYILYEFGLLQLFQLNNQWIMKFTFVILKDRWSKIMSKAYTYFFQDTIWNFVLWRWIVNFIVISRIQQASLLFIYKWCTWALVTE